MTTPKRAAAVAAAAVMGMAWQLANAGDEIPITTSSEAAKLDFIAGQAAADHGDGLQAHTLFKAAIEKDPSFAYAWYSLGNVAFSTEEFAHAIQKAAEVSDGASEGEKLLIEINMRFLDNDFENQLAQAKKLTGVYPHSGRAWLNLGNVQLGLNQAEEARKSYAEAIALDGDLVAAHIAMGNSYLFNEPKDPVKAEKFFAKAIALRPAESNFYWGRGDASRAEGDLLTARDYYTRAILLDPGDSIALVKRGHVNTFLGDYVAARDDYSRGIQVAGGPNKPFLANYKQFTWVYEGKYDKAVAELKSVYSDIDGMGLPDEQRSGAKQFTLTNAAQICMHTGMNDDARKLLDMRAELLRADAKMVGTKEFSNIQEANIAYFDGQLAARMGEFRKARHLAEQNKSLVQGQDNPRKMENYHDLMGLIALKEGDYDEAVEHYRQANPNNIYTQYHLASALQAAGKTDEARALFKRVADFNFSTVGYALIREDARSRIAS